MKKPEKPKRRWTTLRSIKDNDWRSAIKDSKHQFPCLSCGAYGKIKDPTECCVYEGSKYADYIPCPNCGGTGQMNKSHYQELLERDKKDYNTKLEKYKKELSLYKSVVSKLSKEELEYVNKTVR
jgi:hypothetical protein